MNTYSRIISFARPYQKHLLGSLLFNLLYSVLNIFSIVTMLPILGMMFGSIEKIDTAAPPMYNGNFLEYFSYVKNWIYYEIQFKIDKEGTIRVLAMLCLITACSFLLKNIFRYLGAFFMANYRVGITQDLRNEMYKKFLKLPVSFFTEKRKGDMMSRISNDISVVESSIMNVLVNLVSAPFMIITTLVTLFLFSPQLTLFSLIVFPIMGFIISIVGKSLKKSAQKAQEDLGSLFSIIEETLKSSKVIKVFNISGMLQGRFSMISDAWRKNSIAVNRRRELASPASEFLGSIFMLLITWFGGVYIVEKQTLDPEVFLGFIGLFYQILDPSKKLVSGLSFIQSGQPSLKRVLEVLDFTSEVKDSHKAKLISNLEDKIEFKNVGFHYENGYAVVHNLNLIIPKGKTVALIGQSGSGKTTLANLLARFYDVTQGEILIDGVNIKDLKLKDYRNLLGMVTQESVLFNDSVYNNILMGRPTASQKEVEYAAGIANAHEFITRLPERYNTNIGEDGNRFSGGQKQRISIARAVLKNPPIMILDEATSSLDTESEKFVQDALEKMMKNRTSLVIAHRLSTIQKADKIVVMDRGFIVEQGTHQELITKEGFYKKLVELQNFD